VSTDEPVDRAEFDKATLPIDPEHRELLHEAALAVLDKVKVVYSDTLRP
jgi:hypothetical protein